VNRAPWPAPAKLNLFLHVLGRREDGYHELQTAFQFLDICDELEFTRRADDEIVLVTDYDGVPAEQDLVLRAARMLRARAGAAPGVEIRVNKCLPLGGGLGGGSSDAATTLMALNRFWALELSLEELAGMGLRLGADVPVFVRGEAAWAEGVGEKLRPIRPPEDWYLVVVPRCRVVTADVFQATDLTRNTPAITIRDFLAGAGRNDCEKVVRQRYPAVAEALDWLGQRHGARLTGTGACVFSRFDSRARAAEAAAALPASWQHFLARGRNRSPLAERLAMENGW